MNEVEIRVSVGKNVSILIDADDLEVCCVVFNPLAPFDYVADVGVFIFLILGKSGGQEDSCKGTQT
jgi:methyl coenzyme M reductase subunit D